MAENTRLPQLAACRIRVAALDTNGVPSPGAGNLYVSDTFVSIGFTPVFDEGEEITEKNACGGIVLAYLTPPSFKRGDVTITLATPDPVLGAMLGGGSILTDGERIGFAAPPIGQLNEDGVSIEVWTKRIDNGDLFADTPYAWWVYPKVKNLRLGDFTHENAGLKPVYTGQSVENPNWYDGPLNDWPVESDKVFQWIPTVDLPALTDGAVELVAS